MRRIVKLIVGGLVVGVLLAFAYLKDEDGKALLNLSNWQVPEFKFPEFKFPDMPDFPSSEEPDKTGPPQLGRPIYQWSDTHGNLQFSGEPPAAGIEYTVQAYDPNINVIQSVKTDPLESESDAETRPPETISTTEDSGNAYSLEGIEKIFEDVNNIEKLLNQRFKNQEATTGQ
ncbi:MAG: hypothetical protein O7D36_07785, partial [Gammaproteobacteria bacterium]|nr:hypothetical protein [Gammaproteobacteria bacterium]